MDWKIGKSAGCCSTCGREFVAGVVFYSALYDRGAEFERKDFCESCWKNVEEQDSAGAGGKSEKTADRPFSYWRTAVEEKQRKRGIDLELVKDVFDRLEGDEDSTRLKIRYFLSLILMRKRALTYLRTESEGEKEYMVVCVPKHRVEYRIMNPNLTPGELVDVKAELEDMLDMELGEPKAEAAPEKKST